MLPGLEIRPSRESDRDAIESMYPQAFPDEDLVPLLQDLLNEPQLIRSLVATVDAQIIGHALWTFCSVAGHEAQVTLLGPIAVAPASQRQGVGSALIHAGVAMLQGQGVRRVFVLGDPNYYSRLGFGPEHQVEPPYPLPAEWDGAWQSMTLVELETSVSGKLIVPEIWQKPALWRP